MFVGEYARLFLQRDQNHMGDGARESILQLKCQGHFRVENDGGPGVQLMIEDILESILLSTWPDRLALFRNSERSLDGVLKSGRNEKCLGWSVRMGRA